MKYNCERLKNLFILIFMFMVNRIRNYSNVFSSMGLKSKGCQQELFFFFKKCENYQHEVQLTYPVKYQRRLYE